MISYPFTRPCALFLVDDRIARSRGITSNHPSTVLRSELTTIISHSQIMSQTRRSTATSSSTFQIIFHNALKSYERRTKQDLLAHPLAAQLQACDSPGAILAILHQQIHEFDHSRRSKDRFTKWLDPTVNVLYTFSAALGEGVGLVCSARELV